MEAPLIEIGKSGGEEKCAGGESKRKVHVDFSVLGLWFLMEELWVEFFSRW